MKNKLLLNKELYNNDAVRKTMKAFSALTEISLSETDKYYELIFRDCKVNTIQTIREFENYVLIETIQSAGDLYA